MALGPSRPPILRVALTWLLSLGGFGAFFPYASWYLSRTLGFQGSSVGLAMATLSLVGLLAQPLWGHVADRTGRRTRVLIVVTAGAGFGYMNVAGVDTLLGVIVSMGLLSLFSSSVVPNLWAVTMALLSSHGLKYVGLARVAGTAGFGVIAVLFPFVVDAVTALPPGPLARSLGGAVHADGEGLRVLFPIAGLCSLGSALSAATLPRTGEIAERARAGETKRVLGDPRFLRLLLVTFLAFLFMQGPMVLFPLLVHAQGGGVRSIANMWVLMLLLEVPLVASFGLSADRLGIARVVAIGIAAGALRWLISGFSGDLTVVVVVQVLHGVTVWGVILGMPNLVDQVVPTSLRSTAQAVLATVGFGLGSLASNVVSGYLVDVMGATGPARVGGIGAALLAASTPWLLPNRHRQRAAAEH